MNDKSAKNKEQYNVGVVVNYKLGILITHTGHLKRDAHVAENVIVLSSYDAKGSWTSCQLRLSLIITC